MDISKTELGYFKVVTCIPKVWVGDVNKNIKEHLDLLSTVPGKTRLVVFPELSLTGYTCGDLFLSEDLKNKVREGVKTLLKKTAQTSYVIIVGAPWEGKNSALVLYGGKLMGVVGKRNLPEYDEFYEHRWFTPDTSDPQIFEIDGVKIGVEICEDLWVPCPPSEELVVKGGAEIIVNLSASPRLAGKEEYLETLLSSTSGRLQAGYVYVSSGPWESSGDLVFSGYSGIYENGVPLIKSTLEKGLGSGKTYAADIDIYLLRSGRGKTKYFPASSLPGEPKRIITPVTEGDIKPSPYRRYDPYPFVKSENYNEVFRIQSLGLQRRLMAVPGKIILGVSGGTDSTLALLVAIDAIDSLGRNRKDIIGVTMPCFGTTDRTKSNSWKLMKALGIDGREIDITSSVTSHLKELGHPLDVYDVAYENAQARLRTQTLFDLSNMEGGIVLGTGDLSELALGWCTYGADHLSSYNPNVSVPKTLVRSLLHWFCIRKTFGQEVSEIVREILYTPVSPELLPPNENGEITQVSENIVGPYELHDYFLYHTLREGMSSYKIVMTCSWAFEEIHTMEEIKKWYRVFAQRFRTQQFKRSCLPDGPKTGSISLSPRGDWRMPSDLFSLPWNS